MRVVVVGAGDIGLQLCKRLAQDRHDIHLIEADRDKVLRAGEQLDAFVVEGNGASLANLRQAGVEQAAVLAAVTDNDEVNLMACRLAKKLGVATTIARVRSDEITRDDFVLSPAELGTDTIIHPEREAADAVMRLLHRSNAICALEFEGGKIQMLGLPLERRSALLNVPLAELIERHNHPPMRIVAIDRNHHTLVPTGSDQLLNGDHVFAICDPAYVSQFVELTGNTPTPVRNVMILGGGMVGRFIAQDVIDRHIRPHANVKIIEGNQRRAQKIADDLSQALVIHGDGTDLDLLRSEGLAEMDAFVAVTGDDERNIITSLLAKQLHVPRVIAMVNKVEYFDVTPDLGLDALVSKQLLTVNAVQRAINRRDVASIASVPGLDAHITEYIAQRRARITRRPLSKINFPSGAIVGAVMKNGHMEIPSGETQIEAGDRAVVFALPHAAQEVERLFH